MNEAVREFYTWSSLVSLGVAAGAVVMVAGGVRKLTGWSHPFIPFSIALLIVLGGAHYSDSLSIPWSLDGFFKLIILLMNTFLLFCTAIGGQEVAIEGAKGKPLGGGETQSGARKGWFDSWLR